MSEFDLEFESEILSAALRDDAFLKSAVRVCEAHHFGTKEHSWIWETIHDTWKKYRERASAKLIITKAKAAFPDGEKRKPYLLLVDKLVRTKPTHPKSALDELSKFVRNVNLHLALEKAAEAIERGDIDDAEAAILKSTRSIARERKYTLVKWIEEFEERQAAREYEKLHPDEFRVIPTGWKRVDRALAGGGRIGELGLIMGTTGRGKSVGATNLAMESARRGFPTLYIATEMPARQIAQRQDTIWTGYRYDQFKTFEFKPAEKRDIARRLKRHAAALANKLHIASFPVRSATIQDIRALLDDLLEEHDFRPERIVVDSGDHLRSADKSLDSYRLQQADVYWELKRLGEEDGYEMWSTVQAGKEYATGIATAEATSESYDKARIADSILSINDPEARRKRKRVEIEDDEDDEDDEEEVKQPEIEEGIRRLELFLAKYRDGESKLKVPILADFPRMKLREEKDEEEEDE